uniref:CD180 molecule n=1 Tax=Cavia porcellus TaxID=10141 RepID=A0A286XC89_CAVPO
MAPDVSCIFLAVLLSASCEVITSADQMCIECCLNHIRRLTR